MSNFADSNTTGIYKYTEQDEASDVTTFWPAFGSSADYKITNDPTGKSLAADIVEAFGLTCKDRTVGGNLAGLDVRHMDALQLIKMSLMEGSIGNKSGPYEAYVDYATDSIEFREVDGFPARIGNDIYQQIQTGTYLENCTGVMVTGKNLLPVRKEPEWKTLLKGSVLFDCTDMVSNCHNEYFKTFCVIVLKDPHLEGSTYDNGIDNFYNLGNNESLLGYARRKNVSNPILPPEATITDVKQVTIPLYVGITLGELVDPPVIQPEAAEGESEACWASLAKAAVSEKGVRINIPEDLRFEVLHGDPVDKFIGVSGVYITGREIKSMQSRVKDIKTREREIWCMMDDIEGSNNVYKLQEGINYTIAYDPNLSVKDPHIVFANRALMKKDKGVYGNDVTYNIHPNCAAAFGKEYKDLQDIEGTILPMGNFVGLLVEEIWATVDLETPGIEIRDPNGNAFDIAQRLTYDAAALVVLDLPSPIAFAGRSVPGGEAIDQESARADTDPTTQQPLQDSDYENKLEEMNPEGAGGGGLNLNFSFMEEKDCIKLASLMYTYMNQQSGVEIVYTCGPDTNPKVGGFGSGGGVVNSVVHQYSDSGSYTVSVTESGRLFTDGNLSGVTGGSTLKQTESASARGTIVDDMGNHIFYKVRIDGFGIRLGVNMSTNILRIDDKVTCTIHNNPVEI